jgi:glycosyltransferase involved in cell wall biosynthesis
MTALVSVLIPAYNAERWLVAAIRSVLAQSWPRIEVIVVDDGSIDGTLALAKTWESASVKVVTQPNMGAPAARNKALELAQGSYIQWLDADDLLHSEKIATQMTAAARVSDRRFLLSGPFGTFYYRTARARFVETSLWRDLTPVDYFLARFRDNTYFQTDAWLVSRELTDAAGPWTDVGSPDDDGEYFCRVVMQSTGVTFVRDARSYYRVGNPGSLANRRSHKATAALFASKEKCIRYLLALEDSPRTRTACIQLLQDWIFHLCEYEDVVAKSQKLAAELGGTLVRRPVKWKYKPIEWLLGYDASVKARHALRSIKAQIEARIDCLLYNLSAVPAEETEATGPHHRKGNSMRFIT